MENMQRNSLNFVLNQVTDNCFYVQEKFSSFHLRRFTSLGSDLLSQVKTAQSMALMDKHKQVKRQRLDRICEGKLIQFLLAHKSTKLIKMLCVGFLLLASGLSQNI